MCVRAVVVALDRKLGAVDSERGEERVRSRGTARRSGSGCCIRPKTILPELVPLELAPGRCRARLERDHAALERAGEHERGAEHRMPRERQLVARREDADPGVRRPCPRGSTKTVSEKPISSASACIVSSSIARASVNTASWFPLERAVGEDVGDDVAQRRHGRHPIP